MTKFFYYGMEYPLPISEELKNEIKHFDECDSDIYKLYVHIVHDGCDKYYVGVTKKTLGARWGRGKYYKLSRLHTAIDAYGWDNIDHVVLAHHLTEEHAHTFEKKLIAVLHSADERYGYNIALGGKGVLGVQKFGEENPFYGKKHSAKSKELIRFNHADCSGEKNSFYGKKHSVESKRKMSEYHKGRQTGASNPVARKIVNIDTGKIFDTLKDACAYAKSGHVVDVCRGHRPSAGKDENGNPLHWRYA